MEYTTKHPLTVGRASTVHALNVEMDEWGIRVGRLEEGRTYAEALCGQRSPSYNSNHAARPLEVGVPVDCKNCRARMDVKAAFAAAKAAGTIPAAPSGDSPRAKKEARLASLKLRLEAAITRREARGETVQNATELTLAGKIAGVEAWLRSH